MYFKLVYFLDVCVVVDNLYWHTNFSIRSLSNRVISFKIQSEWKLLLSTVTKWCSRHQYFFQASHLRSLILASQKRLQFIHRSLYEREVKLTISVPLKPAPLPTPSKKNGQPLREDFACRHFRGVPSSFLGKHGKRKFRPCDKLQPS